MNDTNTTPAVNAAAQVAISHAQQSGSDVHTTVHVAGNEHHIEAHADGTAFVTSTPAAPFNPPTQK